MSGFTKFFLVALRLAIGWHLLFEGVVKVRTHEQGKTTTNTPFSSAPYLRDANGPLGDFFREQAGDLDKQALAILDDPTGFISYELEKEHWLPYYTQWRDYYKPTPEQEEKAAKALGDAWRKAEQWLAGKAGEKELTKEFAGTAAKRKRTPPNRIAEYKEKLAQLHEMQDRALPEFQRDVFKKQLTDKKAEVARLRTELLADLDAILKEPLQALLTPEQRAMPPLPDPSLAQPRDWLPQWWPAQLGFARGLLPPVAGSSMIHWTDWLVRLGLVCIGVGLLLGLFTRFSCVMGVLILILITLPYLPLPGLPDNPRSLPFYYINQNLIEAIALLALATTASGRWLGLDGLLYVMRPSRYRASREVGPSPNGAVGRRRVAETI